MRRRLSPHASAVAIGLAGSWVLFLAGAYCYPRMGALPLMITATLLIVLSAVEAYRL